jgi:glycine/D-amino acid oxidase-like deaminating enzyme
MDDFCCIFDVVLFDCREVLNGLSVDLGTAIRDQFRSESGDVRKRYIAEIAKALQWSLKEKNGFYPWISETWIEALVFDDSVLSAEPFLKGLVEEYYGEEDRRISISCDEENLRVLLGWLLIEEYLANLPAEDN